MIAMDNSVSDPFSAYQFGSVPGVSCSFRRKISANGFNNHASLYAGKSICLGGESPWQEKPPNPVQISRGAGHSIPYAPALQHPPPAQPHTDFLPAPLASHFYSNSYQQSKHRPDYQHPSTQVSLPAVPVPVSWAPPVYQPPDQTHRAAVYQPAVNVSHTPPPAHYIDDKFTPLFPAENHTTYEPRPHSSGVPADCYQAPELLENDYSPPSLTRNICPVCGKNYARPSTLKTHMRIHSGERPFFCKLCNKSFSQAANLTAHLRVHSGEKPFSCAICHKTFSQSSSVTTHMRTHSGDRPYKCRLCKKGFSDSSTLTKHLRIHSGEKPYRCSFCTMSFSQSGNLNRHMKVHDQSKSQQTDASRTASQSGSGST